MKKINKQKNARMEKWREMLKNDIFTDVDLLKKRVFKGIPSCMRILVWPRLINLEGFKKKSKYNYENLIKKQSISEYDIQLDIPRTFPQQKAQIIRVSLFNVLKALSLVYPQLGYCQGMNFLTMRLLELLDDETVFWMLHYILQTHQQLLWNYKSPGSVALQNFAYLKFLNKHNKKVGKTLQRQEINPQLYTTSWFMTLFSKSLQKQLFFRIFECFLLEGYRIIYGACIAMIKFKENVILQNNMEQNLMYLTNMSTYESSNLNFDEFMQTINALDITDNEYKQYEQEYRQKNKKKIQKMQKDVEADYKKRLEQRKRKNQESMKVNGYYFNIYDFQKSSYQLIMWD